MRKNILIFGHGYATQFVDISNQYTTLFDPKHFDVTVVYLVGKDDPAVRQKHLANQVIFLDSPKASVRGLKISAIKAMLKLHREKNFQIVICHRYKPTYIMLWVSLFKRIPAIISVMHELGTMNNITRRLAIMALARNNIIFAGVSDAVRNDIRKHIWRITEDRVITLYNMIDVDLTLPQILTREAGRQFLNLPEETFVFGTLGRLVKNKDQKTLIQAFALIHKQHSKTCLVIMGDGHLEAELKALAQSLGLENNIIFTGFIADGFRYMRAFDVYISSSTQEAFGRVLLEAMLSEVPIIATSVNGVPEVIGDAGVLINAANPEKLSDEMLKKLGHSAEDLLQQGQLGYQRAVGQFSLQRFYEIFWGLALIINTHSYE